MKAICAFFFTLLISVPAAAREPAVYYCEMIKKIAIDGNGILKNYPVRKFKFKDYKIEPYGKGLIKIGEGLGFPNRLDNITLEAEVYYDENFFTGISEDHGLLWRFTVGTLFMSTPTSEGLLSIVANCENFN